MTRGGSIRSGRYKVDRIRNVVTARYRRGALVIAIHTPVAAALLFPQVLVVLELEAPGFGGRSVRRRVLDDDEPSWPGAMASRVSSLACTTPLTRVRS